MATVAALAAAMLAGGCATHGAETDATPKAAGTASVRGLGEVAKLRAIGGSAVTGKVRVVDRGDGATITILAYNVPIGDYRITINRDANCSSPNGFSAGPAWAPPASQRAPAELVGVLTATESGSAQATVHVRGLRATGPDGVAGHSVVLYAGRKVTAARPDIPNEIFACGVFEPTQVLDF
ncbi:MAG: hypothetical protein ACREX6_08325 [Casimicrobiaceae bacterium]